MFIISPARTDETSLHDSTHVDKRHVATNNVNAKRRPGSLTNDQDSHARYRVDEQPGGVAVTSSATEASTKMATADAAAKMAAADASTDMASTASMATATSLGRSRRANHSNGKSRRRQNPRNRIPDRCAHGHDLSFVTVPVARKTTWLDLVVLSRPSQYPLGCGGQHVGLLQSPLGLVGGVDSLSGALLQATKIAPMNNDGVWPGMGGKRGGLATGRATAAS